MTPEPRLVPDILLERYLTDSLDRAERARLETSLADSPRDQARLEELRADSAAFLILHPPASLVARFKKEQRRGRRWHWHVLLVQGLSVGAAIVLLLVLQGEAVLRFFRTDTDVTVKGAVVLVMYRREGDIGTPVPASGRLAPNDILHFEVKAQSRGFVAVLSRDAQGTVSVYYPFDGVAGAPYDASQPLLPDAVELDDTLGQEDVYAVHSPQPFHLMWAVESLKQGRLFEEAASRGASVGHTFFVKEPRARK